MLLRLFIDRKKSRLNHISFNKDHPMLLVGDSAGVTHSLKLSPNLRWPRKLWKKLNMASYFRKENKEILKAKRDQDDKLAHKLEVKKLEILLQQVSQNKNDENDENFDIA